MNINKIFLVFAIIIAIFIFYASSLSVERTGAFKINFLPTLYHFGIFFMLAFSLLIGVKPSSTDVFVLLVLILNFYAISDEVHQYFIPGRGSSVFDVFIDFLGIIFGILFFVFLNPKTLNKPKTFYFHEKEGEEI